VLLCVFQGMGGVVRLPCRLPSTLSATLVAAAGAGLVPAHGGPGHSPCWDDGELVGAARIGSCVPPGNPPPVHSWGTPRIPSLS